MKRTLRWAGIAGAIGLTLTGAWWGLGQLKVTAPPMDDVQVDPSRLTEAELGAAGQAIADAWAQSSVPPEQRPTRFQDRNQGVYVAARSQGRLVTEAWGPEGGTVWDGLTGALDTIRAEVPASPPDTLQIDIVHSVRAHSYPEDRDWLLADLFRGVRGLAVQTLTDTHRLAPSQAIASNTSNADFIDEATPLPLSLLHGQEATRSRQRYATFGADQLLVTLRPEVAAIKLERASTRVQMSDVDAEGISQAVAQMAGWLQATQQSSGRLTYMYLPSEEKRASGKDNMIRRWMASTALVRWAQHTGEASDWDAASRSIAHNLEMHYTEEDGLGVIRYQGKSKLGALGIAAATVHMHKDRAQWAAQEAALRAAIDSLVDEDGSMRSWLSHPDLNAPDLNNFYPGEALFYWAHVLADTDDPELLERYMRSFRYYREWHLQPDNRNPAFVPWHTQAHFLVWQKTQDPQLAQFILEMNDWLLHVQQWEGAPFPDTQGRFYKPGADFGSPHASSTGVYIEGLIDAWRLATALGEQERAEAYRVAMLRAARSIMQLQFADDVDLFYIEDKAQVVGGIRTRVWDNVIRCDNVQHAMMGMLKMQQHIPEGLLRL